MAAPAAGAPDDGVLSTPGAVFGGNTRTRGAPDAQADAARRAARRNAEAARGVVITSEVLLSVSASGVVQREV
jgi:hypothetical protein